MLRPSKKAPGSHWRPGKTECLQMPQSRGTRFLKKDRNASWPVSRVLYPAPKIREAMTIHLGRLLPDASSNQPGQRSGKDPGRLSPPHAAPIRSCSRWGLPCRARCRCARCALTAPFHPYLPAKFACGEGRRFAFCGTFPEASPRRRPLRRALPGTVFPWSPDFPHIAVI